MAFFANCQFLAKCHQLVPFITLCVHHLYAKNPPRPCASRRVDGLDFLNPEPTEYRFLYILYTEYCIMNSYMGLSSVTCCAVGWHSSPIWTFPAELQNIIFVDPAPPGGLENTIFVDPAAPGTLQNTISVDPARPGSVLGTLWASRGRSGTPLERNGRL